MDSDKISKKYEKLIQFISKTEYKMQTEEYWKLFGSDLFTPENLIEFLKEPDTLTAKMTSKFMDPFISTILFKLDEVPDKKRGDLFNFLQEVYHKYIFWLNEVEIAQGLDDSYEASHAYTQLISSKWELISLLEQAKCIKGKPGRKPKYQNRDKKAYELVQLYKKTGRDWKWKHIAIACDYPTVDAAMKAVERYAGKLK